MADTGTTRLSQKQRVGTFNGRELLPIVRDGETFAGTAQDLAEFVAPLAGQAAPVTQEAIAAANAAAESADAATISNSLAASAAKSAESSAAAAQAASVAALIQPGVYADEPTGRAAVADGQAFKVQGDGDKIAALEYRRIDASHSVLIAEYPSAQIALAVDMSYVDPDTAFRRVDEDGYVLDEVKANGAWRTVNWPIGTRAWRAIFGTEVTRIVVDEENFISSLEMDGGVMFRPEGGTRWIEWPAIAGSIPTGVSMDMDGFIVRMDMPDGTFLTPRGVIGAELPPSGAVYTRAEIDARNAENLTYSQAIKSRLMTNFQRPVFDYNILITYGQSLCNGYRAFPGLSTVLRAAGLFMLGGSIRPANVASGTQFIPTGGASELKPLQSCTQDSNGQIIEDVSPLTSQLGGVWWGESLSESEAAFLKIMMARAANQSDDAGPQFVVVNCGVDGKSVEDLSKGANPNLYDRIVDAVSQIKAIATAQGKTCGVTLFTYNQGEWNYYGANGFGNGATQDRAAYKTLLLRLISDAQSDIAAITGQKLPFITLLGQTGAGFTRDETNLSIGTAQLELSQENENIRLACPEYPYPVKPDWHFTANGARWFGCHFGEVAFRMLRGEDWQPLSLRKATRRGRTVLLDFTVPAPPIKFGLPFYAELNSTGTFVDLPNKGFSFIDSIGAFTATDIEIVSETQVLLTLPRNPNGSLMIRIADAANNFGRASLQDSNDLHALESYYYADNHAMGPTENIASLLGHPYPMNHWVAAGQFVVTSD
ncbi:hypothetical protein [Burkholderia aenigmatica]|uniref:Sialate O-acetylesterase domain-containing protein n=1 Tax=Burkholderia aenigmatica TaxID=2015348 RepID=A0A228I3X7_9BURK|nr:hypothetical protein [Burkholderia aenigmatica]OXI36779.1 hypothetical protein CFB84_32780 [Burkholderia aenigmatica]OXI45876.1 hypothetical protein CFB84_13640 [Burkholderia aenigmatica]